MSPCVCCTLQLIFSLLYFLFIATLHCFLSMTDLELFSTSFRSFCHDVFEGLNEREVNIYHFSVVIHEKKKKNYQEENAVFLKKKWGAVNYNAIFISIKPFICRPRTACCIGTQKIIKSCSRLLIGSS